MAGVTFAVEGDGVGFATESYAASALYTTLASLSGALWRIRRARMKLRPQSAIDPNLKLICERTQPPHADRALIHALIHRTRGAKGSIEFLIHRVSLRGHLRGLRNQADLHR